MKTIELLHPKTGGLAQFLLLLILVVSAFSAKAQSTFYSQANGAFATTGAAVWDTNIGGGGTDPIASDFTDGLNTFIVVDGHTITIIGGAAITIDALQVGEGASGILTIGDASSAAALTINSSLVIQTGGSFQVNNNDGFTHTFTINGDIVNNGGTFDLENGTGLVNTTMSNTATAVLSGSTMTFNDLMINGGAGILLVGSIDVNGNFAADGAGTDVSTTVNHNFAGGFNLTTGATFNATNSIQYFDGALAQAIDIPTGTAFFNSLTFDNSTKTVTGDLISDGTFEITADAVWTGTGGNHQFAAFEYKNTAGVTASNATITFTGGEIRFGDGTATDGTITLGVEIAVTFDGGCSIERDDILIVDGDVEITTPGYLLINGVSSTPAAGTSDSELQVTGTRTLTIRNSGDLYMRGYDNYPTGFTTYVLEPTSLTRYDADFDQIIRGENSANTTITFGRLYLYQADASAQRTRQLFTGDANFHVGGQMDLVYGARFYVSHAATLTFNEDIYVLTGATAGEPVFSAASSIMILDANINQTLDGPVSGSYTVDEFRVINSGTPTAIRRINIDDNISTGSTGSVFLMDNANGSTANYMYIDIDDNIIFGGLGTDQVFTIGANCAVWTSTSDADGFAQGFDDAGDVVNIDAASILRFDRSGDQTIPNFNGGVLGTLQFAGSGNRFIPNESLVAVNLTINGDVTRTSGSPIFRFGSIADAFQVNVSHAVYGDWNMSTTYTGSDESNGGASTAIIDFTGTDQIISSSNFVNVTYSGSGTKTITGTQLIDGDVIINTGVTVNAGSEAIDVGGNWTENGTGTFIQSGSTTDFNGGAAQAIATTSNSYFNYVTITNSTPVTINSTLQVNGNLTIESGSSIDIEAQTLRVGRDLVVNTGSSVNYTTPSTTTIVFDGDTEQDIRNINAAQNFPNLLFEGVGNKALINNPMTIEGDITIASEATFDGSSFEITMTGDNWVNNGNFTHNNAVIFSKAGGTTNVSTSTFHDIEVGAVDGSITTTALLTGNITLNGELNIFSGTTLDAASTFSITVEEDWNNYGIFEARQGTVTFNGGTSDFRSNLNGGANSGTQLQKAFYNLTINLNSDSYFIVRDAPNVLNDQLDVLNNLTVSSGHFYSYEPTNPAQINVGGSFSMLGGDIIYRHDQTKITMNGTSGTHGIDLGGDVVRNFEINAVGAIYQLSNSFSNRNDADNNFALVAGTLDLNGQIMTINRGGLDMSGGTLVIDEGASLLLNDLAVDPDFNKTGGVLQIVGIDGNPATLSSVDTGGFNFTQTGGDIQAQYYTIASTAGEGLRIEGGTIDTGATGNNFSNGTFTSGTGSGYMTLANIALGTITSTNVVFNAGPTYNVALDLANEPASGTIEFIISGGSLAGAQDELDNPNAGATTGFIRWGEDAGLTWNGSVSSVWNNSSNWTNGSGDADGIPDSDDIVYILGGGSFDPVIANGESFAVARVTIRSAGSLTFTGTGQLTIGGNFTNFSGCTVDMTDNAGSNLFVAGAWSNAGIFNGGTATVTFNGTTGTNSITPNGSGDPFYNLVIDGDGATYTLGSAMTVANSFSLIAGTFDASSGLDLYISKDWSVNGGIFEPGQGRVRFNGTSGTQSISGGTMYDARFENAGLKSIDGNISVADDFVIAVGSGVVSGNDKTIFVGDDWDMNVLNGFASGTGTVIFNGVSLNILDRGFDLDFNNIIFQNAGTKNCLRNMNVSGNFSVFTSGNFVDIEAGVAVTITGTLSQTGGEMRIFDNNFPTAGVYSLTGGEVEFLRDVSLNIPTGVVFNNVEIRSLSGGNPPSVNPTVATLLGDITINGNLNLDDGAVELDAAGFTITLGNYFYLESDETLTWNGGTLIHTGPYWSMDADFNTSTRTFQNLILDGTSTKRVNSDIAVNGNLTVTEGVYFQQLTFAVSNDGGDAFVMEASSTLDNRVIGFNVPTGFATYTLDPSSIVRMQASGDQTLFTNGGTLEYGNILMYSTGIVSLDNNLTVQGNFDMNTSPTLNDAGFDMTLNGGYIDIEDHAPGAATTITFAGAGDQLIYNNDGTGQNLELNNVVFGGGGLKTLIPNAGDELTDIVGTLVINSGVTVTTGRGLDFSGTSWINNGTFISQYTTRPMLITSTASVTMDPGVNDIAALILSNTGGTVTIQNNGLNLGNGVFTLSANSVIDFGGLTHNLASESVAIDAAASWILTGSILEFDQAGTQTLPILDEANANITGVPSIIIGGSSVKYMSGAIVVDDLTIQASCRLDVINGSNYQITVNGNWVNNGGDLYERDGTVIFNALDTNPKNIDVNGELFSNVIIQGSAVRTYTVLSDLVIYGNTTGVALNISSATLDLNGNQLTIGNNDTGDPDAEQFVIGNQGTLEIDAGASLLFDTYDDGGDIANTEIGGSLEVQSGGKLSILGTSSAAAVITKSAGNNRIDINILSGATIDAQYYSLQFMTDEGLEVRDGATIDAGANGFNFSNGTWSNLATDSGSGDVNPVAGNRYLTIESDAAQTIDLVVFNFDGTPTVGQHYNVTRSNDVSNTSIYFSNASGPLGRDGKDYEEDGDATLPAESNGQLTWDLPTDTQWLGGTSTDWTDASNWNSGVPSLTKDAVIDLGSPFNPSLDGTSANISALIINDGILKVINSATLDVDGDVVLGDGTGGALIMDNTSTLNIEGSWVATANVLFDHGDGTVVFDAPGGSSVSVSPGNQSFANLTFTNVGTAGEFNMVTTSLVVEGNLLIENSARMIPSTAGYTYTVAGNLTATGGVFDVGVDGELVLNGADQTLTDMSFDRLTASGTGTKTTAGTTVINDNFIIESGVTFSGGGAITFNADVSISGVFNGVASQTYTFSGDDWRAEAGSYTGQGTVVFDRSSGTQYITQLTNGNFPVEFYDLTMSGSAQVYLGRLSGGDQSDGNVDIVGDLMVNNTINSMYVNAYQIDNTSGTGTFTLASGEYFYVTGADNFPSGFAIYALDDNSYVRYWGSIDQVISGGVEYGHLEMFYPTIKTLDGNVDVDGNVYMRNATLDVSVNNYSINVAANWTTDYGNEDGSFIKRSGTVTFDGTVAQTIRVGETGTQSFNNIVVNKSAGNVEVGTNSIVISGDINVFNGTFDINYLNATLGGNMNASGTGAFAGNGLYYLNATSGAPSINGNGSTILGSIEIDAVGRTYELVGDLSMNGSFTLTAGTLDVNGQTLSVGDYEDAVNISGTLNVSTTAKPGGTLALGNDAQLVVKPGGSISLVGTASQVATLTSNSNTDYFFSVTGTNGNEGTIAVRYYLIEYIGVDGIYVNANTIIDATNNFSDGQFKNGISGGKYLRIENDQVMTGANQIANIVFDDNPGGGATNIYKATSAVGEIELFNYSGGFSGEAYDEDPNNLITWLAPPTVTWTGTVSTDWFNAANWDAGAIPLATQDVIIPQTLNEAVISDNVAVAVAKNLTIELNAILKINTTDVDAVDLQLDGNLTFESSASLLSLGTEDNIEIAGSWVRSSAALFTAGTSQVTFNSASSAVILDNNDSFYDLIINIASTATLSAPLSVSNDFTLTAGILDLATSDMSAGGNFTSSGTINAQSQTVSFIPSTTASPKTLNLGSSSLFNVVIGQGGGNDVTYDLSSDLTVTRDFNLVLGTLNPNTNNLLFGDSDGAQDDITIAGTILMQANETMSLGDDAVLIVSSGGDLRFVGTDLSNVATLTRISTGSYDFTVQSGATFEANNFLIEHMSNEGVWLQLGANLVTLSNGTFDNGSTATQYIRLSNELGGGLTAASIAFNVGPTYNVRRNEGSVDVIDFADASGALSGETYELDGGALITWSYANPLSVWNGATSTDWNTASNWTPSGVPGSGNTVQIPDVSGASNTYPIIDNVSGDQTVYSLTIASNALLTVNDDRALTVLSDLNNTGTLTINGSGTISVAGSWTNNGTFNPGTSTVTLTTAQDVTLSGGVKFYNLVLDGNGTGNSYVFSSSTVLEVQNDFTILDGVYSVSDAAHTTTVGGNFVVDEVNGSFIDNTSIVILNGANQNIGSNVEATTIVFNDLTLSGPGVKTLEDIVDINGDLSVVTGVTLSMLSQSMSFAGSSFDIDGALDVSGGVSTITFDGSTIQVLSGNAGAIAFDNLGINNTAVGNSDVQLNLDLTINTNANFMEGVLQSSGSNTLTFVDNATVSFDGNEETNPITLPGQDVDGNSYVVGPIIKIGDDEFIFPTGSGSRIAQIAITSFTGTPTVTDEYSAEYSFSAPTNPGGTKNGSIVRVSYLENWDLSNVNAHSGEPLVTVFWDATSEVNYPNRLIVAHYNGASWDDLGQSAAVGNASGGYLTASVNLTSFSPITLATSKDDTNPLPVELLSFEGQVVGDAVELAWKTASETNNDYFNLQRSVDDETYETIARIEGNGTINDLTSYSYLDSKPYFGVSYYRLSQVDYDGTTTIHKVIAINNTSFMSGIAAVLYPNPTQSGNINLKLVSGDESSIVNVVIYDLLGHIVAEQSFAPQLGESDYSLRPFTTLQTGIYHVRIYQGNNQLTQKLIIE